MQKNKWSRGLCELCQIMSNRTMRTWPRCITKEQTIFRKVPHGILCVQGESRLLKPRSFPFSSGLTMVYNIKWVIPKLRSPTRLWTIASSITFAAVGIFSKIIIGKQFPDCSYLQLTSELHTYFFELNSQPYQNGLIKQPFTTNTSSRGLWIVDPETCLLLQCQITTVALMILVYGVSLIFISILLHNIF